MILLEAVELAVFPFSWDSVDGFRGVTPWTRALSEPWMHKGPESWQILTCMEHSTLSGYWDRRGHVYRRRGLCVFGRSSAGTLELEKSQGEAQ